MTDKSVSWSCVMRQCVFLLLLGGLLPCHWSIASEGIRYAPNPRFAPVDFVNGEKEHSGIMAGYVKLIQAYADTQFSYVYLPAWDQILHGLAENEVDIVAGIHYNEERTAYAFFSENLFYLPLFLVTRRDYQLPEQDFSQVKLAGVKGYATTEFIRNKYPEAQLLLFDSELEALMQTSSGQTHATVIDLAAATAFIETYGLSNLHSARELEFQWDIRIAVSNKQPEIYAMVQDALKQITPYQRDSLYKAYIGLDLAQTQSFIEKYRIQYTWALWIIGFLVALIIVFYNLLQQQVRRKTEELYVQNERYLLATRAASDAIFELFADTGIIHFEENFKQLFGYDLHNRRDNIQNWWPSVHPADLGPFHEEVKRVFKSEDAFLKFQFRLLKANGLYARVEVRCYLIRNATGRVYRIVGALQDITSSYQQIHAIEKQNEQLRNIAWLQSHVIRAPLARLMGLTHLLELTPHDQIPEREKLEKLILEAANELDQVIQEIVSRTAEIQAEIDER